MGVMWPPPPGQHLPDVTTSPTSQPYFYIIHLIFNYRKIKNPDATGIRVSLQG